ncbi:ankyrin repeat-containing domain protein [Xylogone sp. PMI_703]|nr:ankyrin repeat-containing domain protein [Xylogone sp. PMI_703]
MSSSESDEFEVIDPLEASLSPEELARIQDWLQPTDYAAHSSEFHRHLSSQAPGTGLWLSKTSKYQQWKESDDHGILWVKGVPGAGKSVIAASMVEFLQRTNEGTPVLHFFFRYIVSKNRKPRNLIQDFLAQLLPHSTRLQGILQALPKTKSQVDEFSDETLWSYLLESLASIENVYLVVDALDEMEPNHKGLFLGRLNSLATFRPKNVKLMATSRPDQDIQRSLRDASIVHISLEDDLVGKDISLFLSYRLKILLPENGRDSLRESLVSTISEQSRGLFLYARLLLDQIKPSIGLSEQDINHLIKKAPASLEDMYNSMLHQQALSLNIDTEIQVFLLELATHSSRPLRLNELASALSSTFSSSMGLQTSKFVARSACAPLLEVLEDETVQVIHHSFTEFLLNDARIKLDMCGDTPQFPVLNSKLVHRKLTVICLNYLESGALRLENNDAEEQPAGSSNEYYGPNYSWDTTLNKRRKELDRNYRQAKLRYPFLEYAVVNWAFHASNYDSGDADFLESLSSFLDPSNISFRKWLQLEWATGREFSETEAPTPLHVAAFAGLTTYAKKLIEEGNSVDSRDSQNRTPLHWACSRGHISTVSLLLKAGSALDEEDNEGVKPIHEAARKNHASIVRMLLEAGVNPLTPKTRENMDKYLWMCGEESTIGDTAVKYAYLQGHTDTIMAMLPFIITETLEEIFCQCCRYGKFAAARAILDATDLSPNTKLDDASALYLACRAHSVGIVELLLAKGADVELTSQWRVTKKYAHYTREYRIFRLLLDSGADIEAKDGKGDTPLLSLFPGDGSIGKEPPSLLAAETLLRAGANVMAINASGDSVLHRCLSSSQNIKLFQLLFEYGASVDSIGKYGNTIMHAALGNCYQDGRSEYMTDIIDFLLNRGAKCDVKNDLGCTAVECAATRPFCTLETFTRLLRACSDENAIQDCLWKLDSKRSKDETVQFIQAIQSFGGSLENRDSNGRTVLLASTGSKELFEALLECGAHLHAVDSRGRGVLHQYTASHPNFPAREPIQRLASMVDMGLDPLQVDYDRNNLLHERAKIYTNTEADRLFVQKLLDYGISINSKNYRGMTPLHIAIESCDFHSMRTVNSKSLDERFYERHEVPLLNVFRRNQEIFDINSKDSEGLTVLHLAAIHSEALLFYLLGEGADASVLTTDERSILHLACRARQSNIVGYLCQVSPAVQIYSRDSHDRTPLHDACASGCPDSVYHLLKAGADITIVDKNERTPLHSCAESSDEQKIWTLLSRQSEISGRTLRDRFRPAVKKPQSYDPPWYTLSTPKVAHEDKDIPSIGLIAKALLSAGSDIKATDMARRTPLDLAIEYDCPEMIRALQSTAELIQEGRDVGSTDRRLQTVLALKSSSLSTMNLEEPLLQDIFQDPSIYLTLLTFDDIEWISKHRGKIAGEDDLNSPSPAGQSLLYIAVSNGFTQLVEGFGSFARANDVPKTVLARTRKLYKEFKSHPPIKYLAPALHTACSRELSNMDMIEVLVNTCGVDINTHVLVETQEWKTAKEPIEGGTALHILAKANHWWQLDALKYLLQKGADIESTNENGETPLHIACTGTKFADMNFTHNTYGYWRIESVKMLLGAGAKFNVLDNAGLSCLHKASSSPQIMRILLEHGADLSGGIFSPLFSALQIQCPETLTILLDAGVSPDIIDPNMDSKSFELHYLAKVNHHWALFCASFAKFHNQSPKHSKPMIKILIERGANIYAPLDSKETLIHYTFENAEYEILHAFLGCSNKIDFNSRDSKGRTIFLAACDWNECLPGHQHLDWFPKEAAPFLQTLTFGADHLAVDNDGRNALHHLLDNPNMEEEAIIQFLAYDSAKILLHQKDKNGFTPLNYALRILRPTAVTALLAMGADLLCPDPTGATAAHHIAAQCLNSRPPSRRSPAYRDYKPEFYTGLLTLWKRYFTLGGSINACDDKGSPPLFSYLSSSPRDHYKTPKGSCFHLEMFNTYFSEELTGNIDFLAKNNSGENALHIIARREKSSKNPYYNKQLYEFFVQKGLDPLEEDTLGRSSLDIAAACEQKDILELFQYQK